MKRLFKLAALGAIVAGVRKLMQSRSAANSAAKIDLRQPQKTVKKVEKKAGQPVRP
jgi:hypothetical protein